MSNPPNNNPLQHLLRAMCLRARSTGESQRKDLKNGLRVRLYWIATSREWHLLIWRYNVAPSAAEWAAVLAAWPFALPNPAPAGEGVAFDNQHGLRAHWVQPGPADRTATTLFEPIPAPTVH